MSRQERRKLERKRRKIERLTRKLNQTPGLAAVTIGKRTLPNRPSNLKELVEDTAKHVQKLFAKHKKVPTTFLFYKDREEHVMPVQFENEEERDTALFMMKAIVQSLQPDYVVFIGEAWGNADGDGVPLSQHVDRIELVMITAEARDNNKETIVGNAEIVRKGKKVRLKKFDFRTVTEQPGRFSRFYELEDQFPEEDQYAEEDHFLEDQLTGHNIFIPPHAEA